MTLEALTEAIKRLIEKRELTELVMALNWKIWEHYQTNEALARVYNSLWEELDTVAQNNLTGKELQYFYTTTD